MPTGDSETANIHLIWFNVEIAWDFMLVELQVAVIWLNGDKAWEFMLVELQVA